MNMAKFQAICPMIWTKEIKETIDFYINILGFTCDEYNQDWAWASPHNDEAEIMVALPNKHASFEKSIFTGSFCFNVDKVDELWDDLKGKCKICCEIENFDWNRREFAIYDNNGYVLQFGTAIA